MKNKKDKKDNILIYILLLMLLLVIFLGDLKNSIRDLYNVIFSKVTIRNDYNIVISDDVIENYIKELEEDNIELRNLNDINSKSNHKCINATVIYRNPSFWYDELIINKGLKHGITNNSMVITSTGLIGTITDTLNNSSTISLIINTNKKNKITVAINASSDTIYGLIDSYDYTKNELIISDITSDITYEKDMKVVTTNFTNTFESGMLIGIVKSIKSNDDGLSKSIIVTPSTNFNNIKYVCVIGN